MIPVIALAAAACNPQTDRYVGAGDDATATPDAPATPEGTATPVADVEPSPSPAEDGRPETKPDGSFALEEETDLYLFQYAYPAAAGRIPELASVLQRRMERAKATLEREAGDARGQARDNGFPYNKHSYQAEWQVVADLPAWISLSVKVDTYSGGAHGMSNVQSLVWDKNGKRAMEAIALFESPDALEKAVGQAWCDGLNKEREKKRGEPVPAGSDEGFNNCPSIDELTILVGSGDRRRFDRMTWYAGPYVAGPYAEGAYMVNLPVTQAVLDAVSPQYREFFRARK